MTDIAQCKDGGSEGLRASAAKVQNTTAPQLVPAVRVVLLPLLVFDLDPPGRTRWVASLLRGRLVAGSHGGAKLSGLEAL